MMSQKISINDKTIDFPLGLKIKSIVSDFNLILEEGWKVGKVYILF